MNFEIKEIAFGTPLYEASKQFRFDILRRPLGLEWSVADLSDEDTQIHIAAVTPSVTPDGEILGAVVLKPVTAQRIKLRQMAVSPQAHGTGIGRDLVRHAERLAAERGYRTVEMHARISAQGFYEKLGYRTKDGVFVEVTVPTIVMTRDLT